MSEEPPTCGMTARTPSRTQSDTRSSTAAHHDAVIRVYDAAGNVIETHEPRVESKEW